jgi:hypothetical protein
MPWAPKLQRTARKQEQRQAVDTFVVSLHLMIDSRQPSKGTSERGWIVVVGPLLNPGRVSGRYWGGS